MEVLAFFLVLFVLSGIVALILAAVALRRLGELKEQLRALGARLARLEGGGAQGAGPATAEPPRARAAAPAPSPAVPSSRSDFETLFGAQWLTWLGIVAVFLGTAFFVAIDLGRSPLAGVVQVLAGLAVGVGFVVAGRLLAGRIHDVLGQGLLGAGVALLFLSAYGAHGFHRLVPAGATYLFLLGVALAGALLALRRDSYATAILTAGGALLAPGLLRAPGDPSGALFPYLLAINLGGAIVSARRAWPAVPLLLFAGSALLVAVWWDDWFAPATRGAAMAACLPLWLLYAGTPQVAWRGTRAWSVAATLVVVGSGLLFALALYGWLAPELTFLRGTAFALLALAQVGGARLAARTQRGGAAASVLHHTGLAVAVIAVPVQLDLAWVTLAWALFGLILVSGGVRDGSASHRLVGLLVMALAAARVVVPDTAATLERPEAHPLLWNPGFLAGLATVASLGWTARLLARHRERLADWERRLPAALVLGAAVLLLWRVSVESLAWFGARSRLLGRSMERPALLTLSLIWVVYAALLIVAGFVARYRPLRLLGQVVLGLLVLKMLVLDLPVLEAGYRIASFVGVGVVLLAISVLYQRERRR